MASKLAQKSRVAPLAEKKVLRTFRLAPGKVTAAQRILGTVNATETVEMALDLVVFRSELVRGTKALLGIQVEDPG